VQLIVTEIEKEIETETRRENGTYVIKKGKNDFVM